MADDLCCASIADLSHRIETKELTPLDVLLGKCHTQEFASGPMSHNPSLGTARNPWDPSRTVAQVIAGYDPRQAITLPFLTHQ